MNILVCGDPNYRQTKITTGKHHACKTNFIDNDAYDSQEYHVYLGTNQTSVDSANQTDTSGIYQGIVPIEDNSYRAEVLAGAITCYWRIGTLKWGTIVKGDTLSFTTKS